MEEIKQSKWKKWCLPKAEKVHINPNQKSSTTKPDHHHHPNLHILCNIIDNNRIIKTTTTTNQKQTKMEELERRQHSSYSKLSNDQQKVVVLQRIFHQQRMSKIHLWITLTIFVLCLHFDSCHSLGKLYVILYKKKLKLWKKSKTFQQMLTPYLFSAPCITP